MGFIKGTIIGMALGAMAGMVIGAANFESVQDLFLKGKREIRRFKRKYNM